MRGISWSLMIKATSAAVIFFCTLVVIFTLGPAIETRYFPVVGKLEILRVDRIDDNTSAVYAAFRKLRNCDYLGMAWYRGKRDQDGFERVALVILRQDGDESSPNRPVGYQKSGPWKVSIPAGEIRGNSFVELFHRCWMFWPTRTEFYP